MKWPLPALLITQVLFGEVKCPGPNDHFPNGVLLIGISHSSYGEGPAALQYPAVDVSKLAATFTKLTGFRVFTITESDATTARVRQCLNDFALATNPQGKALIFISARG